MLRVVAAFTLWVPKNHYLCILWQRVETNDAPSLPPHSPTGPTHKNLDYLECRKNDERCVEAHVQPGHRLHAWECTRVTISRYNHGLKGTQPWEQCKWTHWKTHTWNCTVRHGSWEVDAGSYDKAFPVKHDISGCPGPRDP
jgi:hypothetical protein